MPKLSAKDNARALRRLGPKALKVLSIIVEGQGMPSVTQVNAAMEVLRRIARQRRAEDRARELEEMHPIDVVIEPDAGMTVVRDGLKAADGTPMGLKRGVYKPKTGKPLCLCKRRTHESWCPLA